MGLRGSERDSGSTTVSKIDYPAAYIVNKIIKVLPDTRLYIMLTMCYVELSMLIELLRESKIQSHQDLPVGALYIFINLNDLYGVEDAHSSYPAKYSYHSVIRVRKNFPRPSRAFNVIYRHII